MNADRLLDLYEHVNEAPEALPRLRRFVLNLAVRGKLLRQDAGESVAERYFKLAASDELPANWRMLSFGKFCNIEGGNQPPKSQFSPEPKEGFVRLFQIRDLGDNPVPVYIPEKSTKRFCREGEILIGRYGASVGKVFWAQNGAYNVALTKFIWPEDAFTGEFAFLLLKSDLFQAHLAGATRSAQAGFNKKDLASLDFPLPPLAEQKRIVAKVEELMALLDCLEAARTEREATRDRLTTASLTRLTAPDTDPEAFPNHARFALDALPALTRRPDQIKSLRQTILNLAVRGKLVEGGDGKLVAVGEYRKLQNGYAFKSSWFAKSGMRLLRNANIGHGEIRWDETVYLPESRVAEFERFQLHKGDIVLTLDRPFIVTGTKVARVSESDVPSLLLQRVGRFLEIAEGLADDYLFLWINSPHFNDQVDPGRSNGVPHISSKQVEAARIFVPSLADQHRIVTKVEELMALCDQLEAALKTTDTSRASLLEALLHESLNSSFNKKEAA
jgi:type I restriction enzyme S subunit